MPQTVPAAEDPEPLAEQDHAAVWAAQVAAGLQARQRERGRESLREAELRRPADRNLAGDDRGAERQAARAGRHRQGSARNTAARAGEAGENGRYESWVRASPGVG